MWIAELLAATAAAQPEAGVLRCEPLDEPAFRSYVLDAQSAIDRGDADLPAAILAELEGRLPCLDFAPAPRLWAELLVCKAIVEHSRGGDWQAPLTTALRIRPAIDRGVGSGHPMRAWEPPPPPPAGPPLQPAPGVTVYVDGLAGTGAPAREGLHLVQKTDGRFWNSALVLGDGWPAGWAASEVDQPARVVAFLRAGLIAGAVRAEQEPRTPSELFGPVDLAGPAAGLAVDAQATFFSPLGVLASASASIHPAAPTLDLRAAGVWSWPGFSAGAGVGVLGLPTYRFELPEGVLPGGPRSDLVRSGDLVAVEYAYGTALYRSRSELPVDASVVLGGNAAALRLELGAGGAFRTRSDRLRAGLALDHRQVTLSHSANPSLRVVETTSTLSLRLDGVWGEY